MLKKILKVINTHLLSPVPTEKDIKDYARAQQKKRDDKLFAKCMVASGSVREPVKLECCDTFGFVTLEEYRGGKIVVRESMILESTNWGGNNGRLRL